MAEPNQIIFSHREVVEALLEKNGIRKGIWGLYVRFGIQAANVGPGKAELHPAAIVPILEMGLQKFDEETSLSIDAATLKPRARKKAAKKKRTRS